MEKGNKMKTCNWLSRNSSRKDVLCQERPRAASGCALTCDSCGKPKTELCGDMTKRKTCTAIPCCQWDSSNGECKSDGEGLDQCYGIPATDRK